MRLHFSIPSNEPFDVVGVGINVIDYLFRVPRFPEPDTKSDATAATTQGGGLTATAMVACARLGLRTRHIGKFGGDEIGRMARDGLAAEGLDLRCAVQVPDAPNRLCFVLVEEGTGRRTIIRHMDRRMWLRPEDLSREAVCSGRALHLDGYEAEQYGREVTGREDVGGILEGLTHRGPPCVGVTSGERGSVLRYRGETVCLPGFPVDVMDTTGAGDVFQGAFLYGLLRGWEARHILLFANAVSALKCTRLGGRAGIPSLEEVHDFLRTRGKDIPASALGKETRR